MVILRAHVKLSAMVAYRHGSLPPWQPTYTTQHYYMLCVVGNMDSYVNNIYYGLKLFLFSILYMFEKKVSGEHCTRTRLLHSKI